MNIFGLHIGRAPVMQQAPSGGDPSSIEEADALIRKGEAIYEAALGVESLPTIWFRAVAVVSWTVASVIAAPRMRVVDSDGRAIRTDDARRAIRRVTLRPDDERPAFNFWADAVRELLYTGSCILWINRVRNGDPRLIRFIPTRNVTWKPANAGDHGIYTAKVDGDTIDLETDDVVHVRFPLVDSARQLAEFGMGSETGVLKDGFPPSPLRVLRPQFAYLKELERQKLIMLKTGGYHPSQLFIGYKGKMDEERAIKLTEEMVGKRSLPYVDDNDPSATLLAGNWKELIEEGRVAEERILSTLGVNNQLANIQAKAQYIGVEGFTRHFAKFTIDRYVDAFLMPLGERMLPHDRVRYYFHPDRQLVQSGSTNDDTKFVQATKASPNGMRLRPRMSSAGGLAFRLIRKAS